MADQVREVVRGDLSFTAKAEMQIYGGDFVKASSANDVVDDAGMSTLADGDIQIERCDAAGDDELCVGIALEDAGTNDYVTVSTSGIYIVRTAAAVTAGERVDAGETDPQEVEVVTPGTEDCMKIGVALTGASAGNKYIAMLLRV